MSTFKPLDGMRKKFNDTTGAYEGIADQNGDDAFPAARFQTAAEVDAARALVSADGISVAGQSESYTVEV
jgi:hypothetical protein